MRRDSDGQLFHRAILVSSNSPSQLGEGGIWSGVPGISIPGISRASREFLSWMPSWQETIQNTINLESLRVGFPLDWEEQRQRFGLVQ